MTRRPDDELLVYGRNACLAIAEGRPDDLIKAWVLESEVKRYGPLLKACAARRRAYHVVAAEELEAVSGSRHHEGVVLLVRPWRPRFSEWLPQLGDGNCCVLALDRVQNPHNLGAILRTAAHFGVPGVVVEEGDVRLTAAAYRTAEGGAEVVPVLEVPALPKALQALKKAGFEVVATSGRADHQLWTGPLPGRVVFLLGSEGEGLAPSLYKLADQTIAIPGTGAVESLNVSAATAVLCGSHFSRFRIHSRPF
ncbi:MAG: rRNA methyltransferase [Deltaproteobacteria bacterium]|nr:rRNA methyltransferase [Deltaproteobacteria bacterium]